MLSVFWTTVLKSMPARIYLKYGKQSEFQFSKANVNINIQSNKINFYWAQGMGEADKFLQRLQFNNTNISVLPEKLCIDGIYLN